LTVADNANLVAGREYRFVFDIYNPSIKASQNFLPSADDGATREDALALAAAGDSFSLSANLQITATGASNQLVLTDTLGTEPTSLSLCANTDASDRKPLFLYKPRFTVKKTRPELVVPL